MKKKETRGEVPEKEIKEVIHTKYYKMEKSKSGGVGEINK